MGKEEEKKEEPEYATQADRKKAFLDLLTEKNVKAAMKWDEAMKLVCEDRRFTALASAGERKQAFAEFVNKQKKAEKDEEREKKKRAKDDLVNLLADWADLTPTSRYRDFAEAFYEDPIFKMVEEDDRDELFQDFMDENEKKTKEERRKKRKEYV